MKNLTVQKDDKGEIVFQNRALSDNSKVTYETGVKQYFEYLEKTGQGEGVDSVQGWLEEIRETQSAATYNLKAQALKNYLSEKYKKNLPQLFGIQELFKRGVKRVKCDKTVLEDDYLSLDKISSLAASMTLRIGLIMEALFWSGCRISELINIKLEDIKVNGKAVIRVMGKGNKERTVYLPLNLYKRIVEVFNGREYLFETKNGKKYHRVNIHKELKRQAEKVGYSIHPHTLRHSKAMYLKEVRKLTPDQVAKALGHTDVSTTLTFYYHGMPTAKDQGILEEEY